MRRLLLVILSALSSLSAISQPFGNEWVVASQPYFKFPIVNTGVYRISYGTLNQTLTQAGFNLATIDPRRFQMFARGQEQHIYVGGEDDGVFDPNDFIEFYARGNDGVLDSAVYTNPTHRANRYYSMFNDTLYYYLTFNASINNARMVWETDVNFSAYTPSPYILRDEIAERHSQYWPGPGFTQVNGGNSPEFVGNEGYSGTHLDASIIDNNWNLNTANRVTSGPDAQAQISIMGLTDDVKNMAITFAGNTYNEVIDGANCYVFNYTTGAGSIGASTTNFSFDITNTPVQWTLWATIASVRLRYAQSPNFSSVANGHFMVPNNPNYPAQSKSYLQISGFNSATARLFDLTNHKKIPIQGTAGSYQALIPDNGLLKHCYITHEAAIVSNEITSLTPGGAGGTPYFTDFNAWPDEADYFAIAHTSLYGAAQAYANYRSTSGYTAFAIDVEELYAQFAWGIPKHPMGIKNFIRWAQANLTSPKHVFLIGKSVASLSARTNPALYAQILVPSMGSPPSDNMYGAFLAGNFEQSPVAIGRLAAKTPQDVQNYLTKMQEYEALPPQPWMKTGMHFSGGGSASELLQIRGFLDSYKTTFEDTLLGGAITTFQKTSSSPFQITQVDSIAQIISNGVQLITFFGHGSAVGFDVSIDHPSTFGNGNGKYPFMLANSCYAGDIHQPASAVSSISEEWVLEPNKGALGFLATIGPGNKAYLHSYCMRWYKELALNSYAQPVGMVVRNTVAGNINPSNPVVRLHNLEYTLHGDPALNIAKRPLPDLTTTQPDIWFEPAEVTTQVDSFAMHIRITNLGAAFNDTFRVEITHGLPNGMTDTVLSVLHPPVYFIDTLTVWLKVDLVDGIGVNNICVRLDEFDEIAEMSETNNDVCKQLNIISPDIIPIYPYEFAVMPNQGITLKASTGDPFAPLRTYRFEVDTTDVFNSPIKQFTTIAQTGGVVEWSPSLLTNMPDSMVYFWRVSVDSATYGSYKWRESSFQYIQTKRGWGQAHFFQFKKDQHDLVVYDRPEREWDFITTSKQIRINNLGNPQSVPEAETIDYFVDNGREEYLPCPGGQVFEHKLMVIVIDPCTLKPWETSGYDGVTGAFIPGNGDHGSLACRTRPERWYAYSVLNATSLNSFVNLITNVIPDSHYVGIFSWRPIDFTVFQPQYLAPIQALGGSQIGSVNSVPYILFAKKGDPSSAIEVVGQNTNDAISLQTDMIGCWNSGQITTPYIGPASEWRSVHLRSFAQENPTRDSIAVSVVGVRPNGTEQVVINGLNGFSTDLIDLYNYVDAAQFPRLRLRAYLKDDSTAATPPQIRRWQVLFEGVPECALSPNLHLVLGNDTLQQGQAYQFSTSIKNISDYPMDSLLVHYWIEDAQGVRHNLPYARQAPLLVGAELRDTIVVDASDFDGSCRLWVEANPVPLNSGSFQYDQLEQYHFNNIGSVGFVAQGDNVNPILDVTFDGIHILDGDIVSSKPMIVMELKDESQFKLLNDTSAYQVFLRRPNNLNLERIWFNNYQEMQFFPGTLPDNKARIEWKANFPDDGIHELWVQGKDRGNNASGDRFMRISFEVINESTITSVLNWPNPFSTRTHFVFTLTGSEMPSYFKIQVMTITGKVVRELTGPELGPMNIGRNITQYAWDGKDTYGDLLANGVYLYRVVAKLNGENIKHRESGADPWITSGFGKMMLIR